MSKLGNEVFSILLYGLFYFPASSFFQAIYEYLIDFLLFDLLAHVD